jgi:2-succinyl-5-enolpyruvyl-6-hydroxy-3-cyclohexene-1-carboxylate synthase
MWSHQLTWLPASTFAPTLYDYGDSIEEWAGEALKEAGIADFVLVGASVGGFCALEMARRAPDRVRAVVLVGSKAGVRRDDRARDHALAVLSTGGFGAAWAEFWQPIWGPNAPPALIEEAKGMAATVGVERLRRGVRAFSLIART